MDALDHAESFYEEEHKKDNRAFSITVVEALRWLILFIMVIIIPFTIFALLRWTVPRMYHRIFRNFGDRRSLFPPYEWSLKASLWIVFVPHAWLTTRREMGTEFRLPSHSPQIQHLHSFKTLIKKGAEMIKEREMRLMTLEAIHKVWNEEERKALEQLRKLGLPVNTKPGRGKRIDGWRREATSTWKRITADCRSLKKQIKVLQGEILEIRDIVRSQTNGKTTGYKGISDWAKDALDDYSENIRILSALSILGAGISYTSIVSALRGNISYMCISFVLFLGCLMVATTLQVVLVWCSRQGNYPFPNPTFWYTIVTIVVVLARLSMAIAMAFLLTSVQVLGRNPDAPPTFTSSPRVCMIATYVVLGGAFTAFSCFTSVFKHKVLTWGRSNEHFSVKVKMLEDLD